MNRVESFDSFEEMRRVMGEREDSANASLLPIQVDLRDDVDNTRYWVRPYPEGGFLIFGEAWSFKEYCDVSASYVDDVPTTTPEGIHPSGDDWASYHESLSESVYEIRTSVESRQRGYLRGQAYSVVEPKGEGGSTHVASVMPISKEAFEEARSSGWKAVHVDPLHLDLMGEEAARKGGWTPTLIKELHELERLMNDG
jgi:hypothetical protein